LFLFIGLSKIYREKFFQTFIFFCPVIFCIHYFKASASVPNTVKGTVKAKNGGIKMK